MNEWWSEIDDAVVACLSEIDGTSPDEIGRRLGMSEEAAVSILGMLAQQGRVRISRVEAVQGAAHARRAGDVDRRRQVSRDHVFAS
jgi:DNA-binding transcriptional regulator LsrR (DeoR family)